ncbi:MAG TPA: alpha/beta hydrolase [Streptosporangiaceae bacterium]
MPIAFSDLTSEFDLVEETAAAAGLAEDAVPAVRRGWVQVPDAGHVSAVFWGTAAPELVFLHEAGKSARAWDAVAIAAGRPAVAIDLPGHGHSDWRPDGRYEPRKIAPAVAGAIGSFAPEPSLIVGSGLGGLAALALLPRHPELPARLALVSTLPRLPTSVPARIRPDTGSGARFATREQAFRVLASRQPQRNRAALRREILYELIQDQDGAWGWRHHPGNLAGPPASRFDDETLWDELTRLAARVTLIRGDWAGRLAAADLAWLRRRAPDAGMMTIPGAGEDIAGTQPTALATVLDQLITAETRRRRSAS